METVRYTADGGRYRAGGITFEPGDVAEVAPGLAEHLVADVGDFEYADDAAETLETAPDETTDDDDAKDGAPDDADSDLVEELQEMTISEFEEDLESGRFDDRLEEVAKAEEKGKNRSGISDAIGVRRAEIEG